MGVMNLLKANWEGKVGQTVGAKWKNKSTIRTYSVPADPKTSAQQEVRTAFRDITSFVALFADQIKYLTALDTSGMSVRNAIIKLNKGMIGASGFEKANLLIAKGGLQTPDGVTASFAAGKVTVAWTAPVATNFTADAKMIVVVVQQESGIIEVLEAPAAAGTITGKLTFENGVAADVYAYFFDKRGSTRVSSVSVYKTGTPSA